MGRKRKRPSRGSSSNQNNSSGNGSNLCSRKRQKKLEDASQTGWSNVQAAYLEHPTLSPFYTRLLSLRKYLAFKLPPTSKVRRRRVLAYGQGAAASNDAGTDELAQLLDSTVVGLSERSAVEIEERCAALVRFSQESSTLTKSGLDSSGNTQSEVCATCLIGSACIGGGHQERSGMNHC
jgi:hypothetical protein